MHTSPLGRTGLRVSPVGFGAFKIGRNQKTKYANAYDLPSDHEAERLLNQVLDLGVTHVDTAPAYGCSEERVGRFLSHRRHEFVLSTKIGEEFVDGESSYDFSAAAIRNSVARSLSRLRTDVLDIVFVHSDGNDLEIQQSSDAVGTLLTLKAKGLMRTVGFSGKTVEGCRAAVAWADVLMLEYHPGDTSMDPVISEAARRGVGVVVKKPLASGKLNPADALRFVLSRDGISNAVVGTLNTDHLRANVEALETLASSQS